MTSPADDQDGRRHREPSEYRSYPEIKRPRTLVEPSLSLDDMCDRHKQNHHLHQRLFHMCTTLSWCGRAQKHIMSWATVTFGE